VGYPVLIKAAAGGGGRGMKVANEDELDRCASTARAEAKAAFGDDAVYIEKYLEARVISRCRFWRRPGNAIHLGERDCSLQRRHQKVLGRGAVTCPQPSSAQADRRGLAKAIADMGYRGAGTVEFLYENGEFYFIEMNTRLQVEHPVTERSPVSIWWHRAIARRLRRRLSVTNRRTSRSRAMPSSAGSMRKTRGPSARHPADGGLASTGRAWRARRFRFYQGYSIPPYYDSLIGKLIVHGRNRTECLMRLRRALGEYVIEGIDTTIPLFLRLLEQPDIIDGEYDIHWLENFLKHNSPVE
jgi:acetyl-CoA carboxylase biotin carboxylase subunit